MPQTTHEHQDGQHPDGNAGDGAVIGGSFGLLEGTLADSEYYPHKSPRMIVDRCMKTRGYTILSDPGIGG